MNQRMKFVIDLLTYVINAPVFIYVLCFCESTTIIFVITLIQFIFNLFILKAAGTNQGYYYLILLFFIVVLVDFGAADREANSYLEKVWPALPVLAYAFVGFYEVKNGYYPKGILSIFKINDE